MKNTIMEKLVLGAMLPVLFAFAAFAYEPGPRLLADYDRDGEIGGKDRAKALASEEFTIWINDDDDADGDGDTNSDHSFCNLASRRFAPVCAIMSS